VELMGKKKHAETVSEARATSAGRAFAEKLPVSVSLDRRAVLKWVKDKSTAAVWTPDKADVTKCVMMPLTVDV
jgi:hypothetical protein